MKNVATVKPRRLLWWAVSVYLLLAGLFYAPLLLGLRTFPDGDFTHHFLPFSLFQHQEWRAGRLLPIWNPYTYSGHPFLADVQAAGFYPLSNLLLLLTLPFPSPGARLYFLQVEAVLHVALAGCVVFLLVHTLTANRWAGLGSGVIFAFSGYLTGYPPLQLAILRTAIWLPLVMWLLLRAFDQPHRWRWWLGAALAYATALLAGHPQTFLLLSYAIAGWIGLLFISRPGCKGPEERRGEAERKARATHPTLRLLPCLLGVFTFYLVSFALSAAQLLPSLELTRYSVRARVDYSFVSEGFPLRDTWQMLFPGVLTQFSPLYIGIAGLCLASFAFFFKGKTRTQGEKQREGINGSSPCPPAPLPFLIYFVLLTLVALLLSYGRHGFLYPLFYRYVPGWDLFRGQERAAYLVAFGLSGLAGYGLAALPGMAVRTRRLAAISAVAVLLLGEGVFVAGYQLRGQTAVDGWTFGVTAGISLLSVVAVAGLLWVDGWRQWRTGALVALAFLNLLWANFDTNLDRFDPARKTLLPPEMVAVQMSARDRSAANLGLPGRVYNEYRVYADYGMRLGVEDTWGSSPLRLARYAELFTDFPLDRLWRLTGVEHVLTWRRELFEPSDLLAEFPQPTDTTYLHRLREPNPRAWLTHQVQVVEDTEALPLLADHTFDLDAVALIPPEETANLVAGTEVTLAPPSDATIHLARPTPNRLSVAIESAHGGMLLIGENWLPGWRIEHAVCNAQGDPAQGACGLGNAPLRADLTLLAVPIPPGQVAFELHYWPDSLRLGLALSGTTAMSLLLILYWRVRRISSE